MTTNTVHPHHHLSSKSVALAAAGAAAVVGGAFAVGAMFTADGNVTAPTQEISGVTITDGAHDSWDGRIGPAENPDGVRDSWMPPGLTDEKLEQLR
jgi:hypothetical protein